MYCKVVLAQHGYVFACVSVMLPLVSARSGLVVAWRRIPVRKTELNVANRFAPTCYNEPMRPQRYRTCLVGVDHLYSYKLLIVLLWHLKLAGTAWYAHTFLVLSCGLIGCCTKRLCNSFRSLGVLIAAIH
ncbi:hypothetical protein MOLA814_01809 [Betaproteobacteria bacterium MOLA814]|jgi:hypothetical protein|nr:hypothetical protein MOLA814_01809 [Betaproteobacteria bacterium MOLA814]